MVQWKFEKCAKVFFVYSKKNFKHFSSKFLFWNPFQVAFKTFILPHVAKKGVFCIFNAALNIRPANCYFNDYSTVIGGH